MDVSLEKVQYKFASIIGELCSQPVILSQFAVWLDLRLAEYKAKGSISLDCSGDKPDPVWLNGLKSSTLPQNDAFHPQLAAMSAGRSPPRARRRNFDSGRNLPGSVETVTVTDSFSDNHSAVHVQHAELRDDSENFIVKQEVEVFPVGLHVHEDRERSASGSFSNERRKRRSTNDSSMLHVAGESGDMESVDSFSAKIRRTMDSSSGVQESSNQSLMSIIGVQDFGGEATPVSLDDVQRDIDLVMAVQMQESQERMAHNSPQSTFVPVRPSGRASSTATRGDQGEASQAAAASRSDWSRKRPNPGILSPEEAEQFGMVELLSGCGVYLFPYMRQEALAMCQSGNRSSKQQQSNPAIRDGQPAARYLLGTFFAKEEIVNGTLSQTVDSPGAETLNPFIINAIIEFCLAYSDSKKSHIKQALYRKISAFRFKHRKKESEQIQELILTANFSNETTDMNEDKPT